MVFVSGCRSNAVEATRNLEKDIEFHEISFPFWFLAWDLPGVENLERKAWLGTESRPLMSMGIIALSLE